MGLAALTGAAAGGAALAARSLPDHPGVRLLVRAFNGVDFGTEGLKQLEDVLEPAPSSAATPANPVEWGIPEAYVTERAEDAQVIANYRAAMAAGLKSHARGVYSAASQAVDSD